MDPSVVGSDPCERLFSKGGSMVACKRVFTDLDFRQSWATWIMEAMIEAKSCLIFPRSDGTKRNTGMWTHMQTDEPKWKARGLVDLTKLPDRVRRKILWLEGIEEGYVLAESVNIKPPPGVDQMHGHWWWHLWDSWWERGDSSVNQRRRTTMTNITRWRDERQQNAGIFLIRPDEPVEYVGILRQYNDNGSSSDSSSDSGGSIDNDSGDEDGSGGRIDVCTGRCPAGGAAAADDGHPEVPCCNGQYS